MDNLPNKLKVIQSFNIHLAFFWKITAWKVSIFGVILVPISRIWTEYGEIHCIFPYSVRMRENADQNTDTSYAVNFFPDSSFYNNRRTWMLLIFKENVSHRRQISLLILREFKWINQHLITPKSGGIEIN